MILLLDNYDSFTYNLADYLGRAGVNPEVRRNTCPLANLLDMPLSGLVISPGPEVPQKAGALMEILNYYHDHIPILGICLGHQAIGQYFGHPLIRAERPMHGKISMVTHSDNPLFDGVPRVFEVVRYNSLILDEQGKSDLQITARSATGEIMAVAHRKLPIFGVQFHPEAALTSFGEVIIKNWLVYNNLTD